MDLVAGAVDSIISKLGELLQAEYKLQKGLPEQIESLKRELESAPKALHTVREVPPLQLDPQDRLWAREAREASYDMEDILDTFLVDVFEVAAPADTESKDGVLKRFLKKMAKLFKKIEARHTIAGAIEDTKKRLQEVSDRRNKYSIPVAVSAPATTLDPRLVHMYKEAAQIIGIERTRAELVAMLQSSSHGHGDAGASSSSNQTKIVSVVGAGGLGKTTLAKAVYDELSPGYDCRAFLSVGRNPDLVQVFTNIFLLLDEKKYKAIRDVKNLQLLIGELRKFLENKRYFIIIDDIWEPQAWERIKLALLENNHGSRVITTTRKFQVAREADEVYKLQPLSHDNSKRLFYMRLFGHVDKCPNNHPDELSNAILKKCGGVPLAIITMASLLLGKSREEWIDVCNSPGFYRDKDETHMENTMHILSLSYYDLPSHLKTCLLYLSIFPEDSVIDKGSLIWKWIAEGFVEKKPGRGLFEVGEEYFHELINRSMIQVQGVDSEVIGIMDGCRVHDMVLDFIISMSCKENFVSVDGTLSPSQARRLALKNRELDLTRDNLPQVRSFIFWGCHIDKWALHPRLKLIRVLALEGCTFGEGCHSLEHIGNLLHLRYLGIQGSWIKKLPGGIGKLKFLQTLELQSTDEDRLELPCSIGMLTQLVCLRAQDLMAPDGVIGRLTSLEELQIKAPCDSVESEVQFVKDLGNLRELRVLDTRNIDESTQIDLVQSLGNLKKMQHLTLGSSIDLTKMNGWAWDAAVPTRDLRSLFLRDMMFAELPSWINSAHLRSLSHLEIHADDVDDQSLKALGGLPELRYLKLGTLTTATITEADGCFKKLRSLMLPDATVVFVANEDSTPSFTICSSFKPVPAIGRKRQKDDCRVVPAVVVMPKLEELQFSVSVKGLMENNVVSFEGLGLDYLPSIRRVEVHFWCKDASKEDVQREEAALRDAIQVHPNRPALRTYLLDIRRGDWIMTLPSASSHGMERPSKRPRCLASTYIRLDDDSSAMEEDEDSNYRRPDDDGRLDEDASFSQQPRNGEDVEETAVLARASC